MFMFFLCPHLVGRNRVISLVQGDMVKLGETFLLFEKKGKIPTLRQVAWKAEVMILKRLHHTYIPTYMRRADYFTGV